MKKPRDYKKGKWQYAQCNKDFKIYGKICPRTVYINCEEMTAKDCRKLAKWLEKAADWMEEK